ncbi:MAG: glycosyltransferase [Actinomycetota bacterium]|nr:glycosyltransferase [Actinomycetota bacterium]
MSLEPLPARPTLTVVIPTLNEAERLAVLLERLAAQTYPADAVVIADAGSTDATREIAIAAGAIVVEGGKPGPGRNAGAAAATTDLILFLDADDEPSDNWIEMAVPEFLGRSLAVAAGQVEPLEREPANVVACEAVNLYLQLVQYAVPHAPGFCILVRRDVHEQIGGFDETVVLAEDHEYVQRTAEVGKFRVLRSAPMRTSMRRIEKEGLVTLAFKYLYSELHVMTGRPMREVPFEYEFAAFDREKRETVHVGLDAFREMWTAIGDPLERFSSEGIERIRQLGDTDITPESIERLLREIAPDEIVELHDHMSRRLEYARRLRPIVLRRIRRAGERVWRDIVAQFGDE